MASSWSVSCTLAAGFRSEGDDSRMRFQMPSTMVDPAGSWALSLVYRDAGHLPDHIGLPRCDYPHRRRACPKDGRYLRCARVETVCADCEPV